MQYPYQIVINDQNSVEPTVVDPIKENHPSLNTENSNLVINNAEPVHNNNEPQEAVPVTQYHHQIQTYDKQPKQYKVQGKVDNTQTEYLTNEYTLRSTEYAFAKAKYYVYRVKKMKYEAIKQAENDKKTRDEHYDEELRKIQFDQTLSKTYRKKQEERLMFRKTSRKVDQGTRFSEYLFEQGIGASYFFIKIPASQQVAMNLYTYVAQDNTYVRMKNIEEEQPVKIYIYENNQRIVFEGEFYYQNYIVFQGEAGAMYLIRVVNNGRTKLISMNLKKLVEDAHIGDTLQTHESYHIERTQNLAIDIHRWHQEFRKIRMLDFQDLKAIYGYIEKYYSWELIESLMAIILCVFQVKTIQNMLKGGSIV